MYRDRDLEEAEDEPLDDPLRVGSGKQKLHDNNKQKLMTNVKATVNGRMGRTEGEQRIHGGQRYVDAINKECFHAFKCKPRMNK